MSRSLPAVILILWLVGCADEPTAREVDLTTQRLTAAEVGDWPLPAVESGHPDITVRQVFTAQGPCRELEAEVMPRYPGQFMLRVVAHEPYPCDDETPHIGYIAVLRGLPAGSHQLRVVHVGADGRTLAETVFEHPIVVTAGSAQ
ncbi:hypothetical protein BH23GEM3_BH23GEM3_06920 [soil metagenome]|nr:hypothetical protein [Gemmatimonadota bacterium]